MVAWTWSRCSHEIQHLPAPPPKAKGGSPKVTSEDHCLEGQSLLPQEPDSAFMYLHFINGQYSQVTGKQGETQNTVGFSKISLGKANSAFLWVLQEQATAFAQRAHLVGEGSSYQVKLGLCYTSVNPKKFKWSQGWFRLVKPRSQHATTARRVLWKSLDTQLCLAQLRSFWKQK